MADRSDNPYLPLTPDPGREDSVPWRVAGWMPFALRGFLVAMLFAPLWRGYAILVEVAIAFGGQLPGITNPGSVLNVLGVTLASVSYGAVSVSCASLVAHRKSWLQFFVARAGVRSGATLLQGMLSQRVRSASAELLFVQSLHNIVPMCVLIILFVQLADRRLSWTLLPKILVAVIASVVATELLLEYFMPIHFRSSVVPSFVHATVRDSVLLVVLAMFLYAACRISIPRNVVNRFESQEQAV